MSDANTEAQNAEFTEELLEAMTTPLDDGVVRDPEGNPTGVHVSVPSDDTDLTPDTDMPVVDEGSGMDELPEPSPSTPVPNFLPAGDAWNQEQINTEAAEANANRKQTLEELDGLYRAAKDANDFSTAFQALQLKTRILGMTP